MQDDLRFEQGVRKIALRHADRADIAKYLQRDPANRKGPHNAGVERKAQETDGEQKQDSRCQRPALLSRGESGEVLRCHSLTPRLIHQIAHAADRRL